jgi:sec-independent protein translocase protein TatA
MGMPGLWELLLIAGIVILLFGGRKLPQLGMAIGESIKNFKKGLSDESKTVEAPKQDQNQNKPS